MTPNYTNDPSLEAQQLRLSSHLYIMKKGQILFEIYQKVLEGDLFLTDSVVSHGYIKSDIRVRSYGLICSLKNFDFEKYKTEKMASKVTCLP